MKADSEGLIYSGIDSSGSMKLGWLGVLEEDLANDLDHWKDAIELLRDPPGFNLVMLRRCRFSEFLKLSRIATNH